MTARLQLSAAMLFARDEIREASPELRSTTIDPADADLPCLILYPNLLDFNRLDGSYELTVDVVAVAGGLRPLHALDQLDVLLSALVELYPNLGEVRAVSVVLPSQNAAEPLPALQTTITLSVHPEEGE